MTARRKLLVVVAAVAVVVAIAALAWIRANPAPAMDEAMAAGKRPSDFPHASADFFHDMDGAVPMTPAEVRGRNTWLVWTGGNEAFWDWLASNSFGTFDLLKTISSYPCSARQQEEMAAAEAARPGTLPEYQIYRRSKRFTHLGLMNEPGFTEPIEPDEYGLCLDRTDRSPDFDEAVYGKASGVLGLRLYPNPNFDEAARERWNANRSRFYTDPAYFSDRTLVRPYRVGMSCAFCHVSFHPLYPPADPEKPEFRNFSATVGAQYLWFGRVFAPNLTQSSFVWHLIGSARPGAVDTSFVPTDHINNPRAMNAVFDLRARLEAARRFHKETSVGGSLDLPEVQKTKKETGGTTFGVAQILWDGADSVGIDAALTRVYINIGEYHQEWIRHVQPIVGGRPQSPIEVKVAQKYSTYWNATAERSGDLAAYLIRAGSPMRLKDAPAGEAYLRSNRAPAEYEATLARGKIVFAENCARCHSSKLPAPAPGLDDTPGCGGANYLDCWDRYWKWTETEAFKAPMRQMVLEPDFLENNYLSTDARIPVTLLGTEICSSMASNAIAGYVWDNFSSADYKSLPSVGTVTLRDPVTGKSFDWTAPGGGRGYQRVPSLISVWATAPFLHNNEVGTFTNDPSVAGRMAAFDDAIRKLFYLKPRDNFVSRTRAATSEYKAQGSTSVSSSVSPAAYRPPGSAGDDGVRAQSTCPGTSWLTVYTSSLPAYLQLLLGDNPIGLGFRWFTGTGSLVNDGQVRIGPIPEGTPVNLLSNLNVDRDDPRFSVRKLFNIVGETKRQLRRIADEKLDCEQSKAVLAQLAADLRSLSTCPDFVVDRGHDFAKELPDADKEALIDFVKTF